MEKTIEIPEGYEARIEGNKVILEPNDERMRKEIISFIKEFEKDHYRCIDFSSWIAYLERQEQPMPDSTKLIEFWNEDKEMLKEKDFRDDAWRLAYNAFMCGFGRGLAVKRPEQPEVDLEKEIAFRFNGKEVSWDEIPLEYRKHDYPYYFDGDIDCYPFIKIENKQ